MSNTETKRRISASTYLLGTLGVLGFGGTLPFTTLALGDFTPAFLTFFRAFLATILAGLTLIAFRKPVRHKDDGLIFVAGLLIAFAFPGMMAIALQTLPAAHGGVILGFMPLATALFSRIYTGEKSSPLFWTLSVLGALIIAAFILYRSDGKDAFHISAADLWLVAGGLSSSFAYVLFGKLSRTTPGWEIISRSLILMLPITLLGCYWFYEPRFLNPSSEGLISILYLGTVSMFLGLWAWNTALARGGIAKIGQLQLLQIFFTIIIAALLLGETIDAVTILAATAITAIIAISRKV